MTSKRGKIGPFLTLFEVPLRWVVMNILARKIPIVFFLLSNEGAPKVYYVQIERLDKKSLSKETFLMNISGKSMQDIYGISHVLS